MEVVGNVSDLDEFAGIHYIKNMNKRAMRNPGMVTGHESRL